MRFRAKVISAAAAAIALAGLGAGIAYASIPGPDGVINGCYKDSTGMLIAIDSSASCPTGYTALNWNQTGPQGPAGATGPTGPAGPPATSTVVYTDVHYPGPHSGGSFEVTTVDCPSGDKVINGGVDHTTSDSVSVINGGAALVPDWENASVSPNPSLPRPVNSGASWKMEASAQFNSSTSAGLTVTYYAICE